MKMITKLTKSALQRIEEHIKWRRFKKEQPTTAYVVEMRDAQAKRWKQNASLKQRLRALFRSRRPEKQKNRESQAPTFLLLAPMELGETQLT